MPLGNQCIERYCSHSVYHIQHLKSSAILAYYMQSSADVRSIICSDMRSIFSAFNGVQRQKGAPEGTPFLVQAVATTKPVASDIWSKASSVYVEL